MIRTVIVDDEPLARELLRTLLAAESDVVVVGEFGSGDEAAVAIRSERPDLLFLDVQMPEKNGFQVLQSLDPADIPPVIFVTAYDQFAVQAFDVHALDYVLKPLDEERLAKAVERVRQQMRREHRDEESRRVLSLLDDLRSAQRYRDHLVIRTTGRAVLQPVRDIDWIEAAGKYVQVHAGNQSHTMRETMAQLEELLNPRKFLRVSRSAIVNVDRIREVQTAMNGDYTVLLRTGARVPTTRGYRQRVQDLLRGELS
jgi:two-component system LytT family response regulator